MCMCVNVLNVTTYCYGYRLEYHRDKWDGVEIMSYSVVKNGDYFTVVFYDKLSHKTYDCPHHYPQKLA